MINLVDPLAVSGSCIDAGSDRLQIGEDLIRLTLPDKVRGCLSGPAWNRLMLELGRSALLIARHFFSHRDDPDRRIIHHKLSNLVLSRPV